MPTKEELRKAVNEIAPSGGLLTTKDLLVIQAYMRANMMSPEDLEKYLTLEVKNPRTLEWLRRTLQETGKLPEGFSVTENSQKP